MAGWLLVGGSIGGMTLPWGIGKAFVRIGAGAMLGIVFITVIFNLAALILFISVSLPARVARQSSETQQVEPAETSE